MRNYADLAFILNFADLEPSYKKWCRFSVHIRNDADLAFILNNADLEPSY